LFGFAIKTFEKAFYFVYLAILVHGEYQIRKKDAEGSL